jgi:hypothetical protein
VKYDARIRKDRKILAFHSIIGNFAAYLAYKTDKSKQQRWHRRLERLGGAVSG